MNDKKTEQPLRKPYNDLPDDKQADMCQEFQERYYKNYTIEDIDSAFIAINPSVALIDGSYDVWDAHKTSFEKELANPTRKRKSLHSLPPSPELLKSVTDILFNEIHGGCGSTPKWEQTERAAMAVIEYFQKSPSPVGEAGGRWVKASERLPKNGDYNARYAHNRCVLDIREGKVYEIRGLAHAVNCDNVELEWLEWLDAPPTPQGQERRIQESK